MFLPFAVPISSPTVPSGSEWRHQVKIDGWRVQIHRVGRDVRVFSRNGRELTERLPALVAELRSVPAGAVLDAELALVSPDGRCDFAGITSALRPAEDHRLSLWAFDVLRVRGRDVREEAFADRERRLVAMLHGCEAVGLHVIESFEDGAALLRACEVHGHEGIVSKRTTSRYVSGRCQGWRKIKTACWREANRGRWEMFAR